MQIVATKKVSARFKPGDLLTVSDRHARQLIAAGVARPLVAATGQVVAPTDEERDAAHDPTPASEQTPAPTTRSRRTYNRRDMQATNA